MKINKARKLSEYIQVTTSYDSSPEDIEHYLRICGINPSHDAINIPNVLAANQRYMDMFKRLDEMSNEEFEKIIND